MKNVKDFISRLKTETNFAQKYAKLTEDEFVTEAKKDGYEFSKEEFNDIANGKVNISMEDLENVSGGSAVLLDKLPTQPRPLGEIPSPSEDLERLFDKGADAISKKVDSFFRHIFRK